ncbi:hypothetical protein SteCoe_3000 [Stentor coeruleus]|uniref:Uncharacterized protein n=1 Tax=Stentor coeruleus TaxID=5963 RepID=A0A1R2CY46_9CILI|nr:hypothetical protein SteCoe_3000 [Stentor coeruleus]
MVEELLGGLSDWRGTQDIIRLTIKALTEVVKTQGMSISQIYKQLSSLPDSQTIEEIVGQIDKIEAKINNQMYETTINDKVSKKELQSALSNKVTLEQFKCKLDLEEFYDICKENNAKFEKIQTEFNRKLIEMSMDQELKKIHMEIQEKPSWKEVNDALESKVGKDSISLMLNKKANRNEIEELLKNRTDNTEINALNAKIDTKVDRGTVEGMIYGIQQKVQKNAERIEEMFERSEGDNLAEVKSKINDLQKGWKNEIDNLKKSLNPVLNKKADYSEVENLYDIIKQKSDHDELVLTCDKISKEFKQSLLDIKKDIKQYSKREGLSAEALMKYSEDITKVRSQLLEVLEDRKKDTIEHGQFLKSMSIQIKSELRSDISNVSNSVDQIKDILTENYAKKQEIISTRQELRTLIDQKCSKEELHTFISTSFTDLDKAFKAFKQKAKTEKSKTESKILQAPQVIKEKPNYSESILSKADKSDLEALSSNFQSFQKDLSNIKSEQQVNNKYLESHITTSRHLLEELSKEIKIKPSSKEILALIDNKANIDDTNKALIEIHQELDNKVENESFTRNLGSFERSITLLWSGNSLGRWAWKSGDLRNSNLIPWEQQLCNTIPEILMWEKDKTSIVIMTPGIYLINLALISKKKSRVQFNINGECILDASSKSALSLNRVFSEFLNLPPRARISITFIGEGQSQGILEMIKYT